MNGFLINTFQVLMINVGLVKFFNRYKTMKFLNDYIVVSAPLPFLSLFLSLTNEVEFPTLANIYLDKFSSDIPRLTVRS